MLSNELKLSMISIALLGWSSIANAYVTFYNNSDATISVTYKLCTPGVQKCSDVSSTDAIVSAKIKI